MTSLVLHLGRHSSPLGELLIATDDAGQIYALDFADYEARLQRLLQRYHGLPDLDYVLRPAPVDPHHGKVLDHYFLGQLDQISTLKLCVRGTDFQNLIWQYLRRIPAGQTTSYSKLAGGIGRPKAIRAAGAANGANPIAIIVPCHRVVGSSGALTGYAGGLWRKQWLLAHEEKYAA